MATTPSKPQFERECRYGHGPLKRSLGGPYNLRGVDLQMAKVAGGTVADVLMAMPNSRGFSVHVHTCQTCGYVELSDTNFEREA